MEKIGRRISCYQRRHRNRKEVFYANMKPTATLSIEMFVYNDTDKKILGFAKLSHSFHEYFYLL